MASDEEIRYARCAGGIDVAYKVRGEGPTDIVYVPGFVSHLDLLDDVPFYCRPLDDMARFARVVTFDKRGTGLSDRSLGFGSLADRMDDIRAVMDAVGIERAALFGVSEGGPLAILFAATYPDRVSKLCLYGTFARAEYDSDYEIGLTRQDFEASLGPIVEEWGTGKSLKILVQNIPPEATPIVARYERNATTPRMVEQILRSNFAIDVRHVLSAISVPVLVMHAHGDPLVPVELGRWLAEHIPSAEFVDIEGEFHGDWNTKGLFPQAVSFLAGEAPESATDRMLATVLFTDIVSSTETDFRVGDHRWRELLDQHDDVAKRRIARHQGRLVKTTGDGLLATFDGPARAITCAQEIALGAKPLGLDIRAGLHTGEVEVRGDDITGLGVVIARRVCDLAAADELLASRTVKDLVIGSGIPFADRGVHTLKGVPDDWQLFAVAG
ncbi:alpha/beta fold hydrolase [Mycolicibacterium moriokaense]|nr:alpha/beta fold hydrolase [Mycolicibacterium moriokaense]